MKWIVIVLAVLLGAGVVFELNQSLDKKELHDPEVTLHPNSLVDGRVYFDVTHSDMGSDDVITSY